MVFDTSPSKLNTVKSSLTPRYSLIEFALAVLVCFLLASSLAFFLAMPAAATASPDFYQQQIDKLSYSAKDYQRTIVRPDLFNFSNINQPPFSRSNYEQEPSPTEERDRLQLTNPTDTQATAPTSTITMPPAELAQPAPTQEILTRQNVVPQRSRLVPLRRKTNTHTDPYSLVAAKRRHSTLIGSSTYSRSQGTSAITAQLSKRISHLNSQFFSTIKQPPSYFQTALVNRKDELQQLSFQHIEHRRRNLETVVESFVKTPLRHVFRKIELLSQRALRRLS